MSEEEIRILGRNEEGKSSQPLINTPGGNLIINFPEDKTINIIKVVGVGGGGSNAVRNMYEQGVTNVNFAICNTDSQALSKSPVPMKVQLGPEGLGVGGNPEKGRRMAEESMDDIKMMLGDETQMLFLTAGMGGGTGTGAAPLIARCARERGILTVGVITLPFKFEKHDRIEKALIGVEELKKEVDSLLVINNERLLQIYSDGDGIPIEQAFEKADEVLTTATKSIAEIITVEGNINRDFNDVKTVMQNGGSAIMSVGYGEGENRILKAMDQAIRSPLLNSVDVPNAQKLLYIIYTCKDKPVRTTELQQVNEFMDTLAPDLEVLWGLYPDDTLGEQVKVAIVATGFDKPHAKTDEEQESERAQALQMLMDFYYPKAKRAGEPTAGESTDEESSTATASVVETTATPSDITTPADPKIPADESSSVQVEEDDDEDDMSLHIAKRVVKAKTWFEQIVDFLKKNLGDD